MTTDDKTQQPLDTMADEFEVPEIVQDLANKRTKALTQRNKLNRKLKGLDDQLIDAMHEHDIEKCRVLLEGGTTKILELTTKDGLKLKDDKPQ